MGPKKQEARGAKKNQNQKVLKIKKKSSNIWKHISPKNKGIQSSKYQKI